MQQGGWGMEGGADDVDVDGDGASGAPAAAAAQNSGWGDDNIGSGGGGGGVSSGWGMDDAGGGNGGIAADFDDDESPAGKPKLSGVSRRKAAQQGFMETGGDDGFGDSAAERAPTHGRRRDGGGAIGGLSLIHISEPRDATLSRMPSSA